MILDSAEKPPFILQKCYDRTVAINGQSVSRIAGAYEETEISPPANRAKSENWSLDIFRTETGHSCLIAPRSQTSDYVKRALALTASLPHDAERREVELNLQLLEAVARCASKGYAAGETGHAFDEARHWLRPSDDIATQAEKGQGVKSLSGSS